MDAQITTALNGIVTVVITVLGGLLVRVINQTFSGRQVVLAKEIALEAVKHAEEIAPVLCIKGAEKFQQATIAAMELAAKAGVNLAEDQWDILLNSALKTARLEWDLAKGRVDRIQPVIISTEAAPVEVPDVANAADGVPALDQAEVEPLTTLQPILDAATQAYNKVVQDSMQALNVQVK